jgi:protein-S-isoprenylcysteine O-methyltransferase Ste14
LTGSGATRQIDGVGGGLAVSKLGLGFAVVAGLLVVLGLAALGSGGIAAFLAEPARVALALVALALTAAATFSEGNLSGGVREDRADRWVLVAFAAVGLLLSYLPARFDRLDVWTIDGDAVRWTGVAVFAVGGTLRLWPVFVLGRRFSGLVAIQPGHALVTTGVYARIRHPSYLGLMLASIGWALAFRSGVGLLLTVALLVPLVARIGDEERLLATEFGGEWDAYCRRTWRLVPVLW